MTTREQAIEQVAAERAAWQALLAEIGTERMEEPGPMGDWTFKDLVAHLWFWQDRTLARLAAGPGQLGKPMPWPPEMGDEDEISDWDEVNAWIRDQYRNLPLFDVLQMHDQQFQQVADLLASMPDEHLLVPGAFGYPGMEQVAMVDAEFFDHFHDEHEAAVRAWLAAR